jgi:hypothetical protein
MPTAEATLIPASGNALAIVPLLVAEESTRRLQAPPRNDLEHVQSDILRHGGCSRSQNCAAFNIRP